MRGVAYLCLLLSLFLTISSIKAAMNFIDNEGLTTAHSLGSMCFALVVLFNLYHAYRMTQKTVTGSKVFFGLNLLLFAAALILGLVAIFSLGFSSGISLLVMSIYFLINVGLYLLSPKPGRQSAVRDKAASQ